MNRTITLAVVAIACVAAVSWFATLSGPTQAKGNSAAGRSAVSSKAYLHSFNLPSSGLGLEGYCPVAYFAVNKPVRGKAEHASSFEGVTYYLVSADAKRAFDADPKKYLPAYGGWCAFGMSVQDKFPVDPQNFKIVDGELMLFLKNKDVDALQLWNQGDEQANIKKSNAHWRKVAG